MDSLLQCIVKEITRPYTRISVISNPDGFLRREDTMFALKQQAGITILASANWNYVYGLNLISKKSQKNTSWS